MVDRDEVTLKEYLEKRLSLLEQLVQQRLDAVDRILELEKSALDHRLDNMNEVRGSLEDQAAAAKDTLQELLERLYSRNEHEAYQRMVQTQFETLATSAAQMKEQLRSEQTSYRESVGLELKSLEISRATLDGKASQGQMNRATLLAVISLIMAFVAWATRFFR
jgi:hypothetical protein